MTENAAPLLARMAEGIAALRAAVDRIERNQSDPEEINQALSDIASSYSMITQLAEVAGVQRTQILEIAEWVKERMGADELRTQFDDQLFVTKQLISIMQGTRVDIVQMRATLLRLIEILNRSVVDSDMSSEARALGTGDAPEPEE